MMNCWRTVKDSEKFNLYLMEKGFSKEKTSKILELAPNVILSQSKILVNNGYASFLVSENYEHNNEWHVEGIVGDIVMDVKREYSSEGMTSKKATIIETINCKRNDRYFRIPTHFDTLLIEGMPEKALSLAKSEYKLYFGEVFNKENLEILEFYKELLKEINRVQSTPYILESDTLENKSYCLIKRK